jgi:hypothetical protein
MPVRSGGEGDARLDPPSRLASRSLDRLSPIDLRPAETHRDPGGDQLQHELAGVTRVVRHIIGKLYAGAPLCCHHPHLRRRCAGRKPVPEHRQPMPFGEIEEHCRIAAGSDDPSGRRVWLEPMLTEIFLSRHALYPILAIEDHACSTVGIEQRRRGRQLLELMSGLLATAAIAGAGEDRRADGFELHLAALAGRGKLLLLLAHGAFPSLVLFDFPGSLPTVVPQ